MKDERTLYGLASFWDESGAEFSNFVAGGEVRGICGNTISSCGRVNSVTRLGVVTTKTSSVDEKQYHDSTA